MFSRFLSIMMVITLLTTSTVVKVMPGLKQESIRILSQKNYSLADRYENSFVNGVFSDNILLTLAYMRGTARQGQQVNWNTVKGDFTYTLILKPGQTFAFHDEVLPQYKNSKIGTTNAHFSSAEGFKYDGWLVGDGVCHLASFMNVVAREANLQVTSPTSHDFAAIPDVPKQYGVAIYYSPNNVGESSLQNLYITNTLNTPVAFVFIHSGSNLRIQVEKTS